MPVDGYVHGYEGRESERLRDQANTLAEVLHCDTIYPPGSQVLEAGCGVGAQTVFLASNSPEASFTAVDISEASLKTAALTIRQKGITNVRFQRADIFDPPFPERSFDHVFLCFVLEHLQAPVNALNSLKKLIKQGGTLTVIEGDHGSFYCYPETPEARRTVQCLIDIQAAMQGNALVGRALYPLLREAGFDNVTVSPRMIYVDDSRPALVDGFTRKTFTAMVEGVKGQALAMGLMEEKDWNKGIADLYQTASGGGTFCYTFFKALARITTSGRS